MKNAMNIYIENYPQVLFARKKEAVKLVRRSQVPVKANHTKRIDEASLFPDTVLKYLFVWRAMPTS